MALFSSGSKRTWLGMGLLVTTLLLLFALGRDVVAEQKSSFDPPEPHAGGSTLRFIANRGQWDSRVLYKLRFNGGNVYFSENYISYEFLQFPEHHHPSQSEEPQTHEGDTLLRSHVVRVRFEGAAIVDPIPDLRVSTVYNYFLGSDPDKWAGGVPAYEMISYPDIYPGIDLRIYGFGDRLKYDFVVHPGADAGRISMLYEGADALQLIEGALHVGTSIGSFTEEQPFAYQEKGKPVPCNYQLRDNRLSFSLPSGYNKKESLVIDPQLIFATYVGSASDNWGFTATYDHQGNAFGGGIEWSGGNGFPVTPGAIQPTNGGGSRDITLSKFDPTGANLIYATYLGGSANDQPQSLVVNNQGELYIYGRSNSSNFPTTSAAYDTTNNGGYDIVVAKLSASGQTLLASTYIGGSGADGLNFSTSITQTQTIYNYGDDARGEIIVDGMGKCYVTAPSKSSNFPTTANVYKSTLSGTQDAVLFKLSADLSTLEWSTFFGGDGYDAAYSVKINSQGDLLIAGGTSSTDLPVHSTAQQLSYDGHIDGFIAKLSSDVKILKKTTYLGTPLYDQIYLMDLDKDDDVYVSGQTMGLFPIISPAAGTVYSNANSRQFVTKLNADLDSIVYSTVFGQVNGLEVNISPTAFLVDNCENVYVTGWGGITNFSGFTGGMPVSPGAIQSTTDGSDIYLMVLEKDAQSVLYATYLGGYSPTATAGEHVDGGTSRFDKNGIVYHAVCAQCGTSAQFPTTPGVYSPLNGYPLNCNMVIFKLNINLPVVNAAFDPLDQNFNPLPPLAGCAPLTVNFSNLSNVVDSLAAEYTWDFGDNSGSTLFEPTHTYTQPGTYSVMLIIKDTTSCNIRDTAWRTIIVLPVPQVDLGPDLDRCSGDTITLNSPVTATSYNWLASGAAILGPSTLSQVTLVLSSTTTLSLEVGNILGCKNKDSIQIDLHPLSIDAGQDFLVCLGDTFSLSVSAGSPASYAWSSSPPVLILGSTSPQPFLLGIDSTTVFYVVGENAFGCRDLDSVTVNAFFVEVSPDTTICAGDSVRLLAQNGQGFQWIPNDGSLSDPSAANPWAFPTQTTNYSVVADGPTGCKDTAQVSVTVRPLPVAYAGEDTAICIGEVLNLLATGGQNFSWSPGILLSDSTAVNPSISPQGNVLLTLTTWDGFGCRDTDQIVITVNTLPVVDAGLGDTICRGDTLSLLATGAASYLWDHAAQLSDPGSPDPGAFPPATTQFVVTGTDANGCSNRDSVTVRVIDIPQTLITGKEQVCDGSAITLSATGGTSIFWSTGEIGPSITVSPDSQQTFYATGFTGQCEGLPDSFTVTVIFELPTASFLLDSVEHFAPYRTTLVNTSMLGDRYEWDFGPFMASSREMSPTVTFPAAEEYNIRLIVISAAGCRDTTYSRISLSNVLIFVPTAFTPNGDQINDWFRAEHSGIREMTVQIFTRWGYEIYTSTDPYFQWNGTHRGAPSPEGVYVWLVKGIGENDVPFQKTGTVTLLR